MTTVLTEGRGGARFTSGSAAGGDGGGTGIAWSVKEGTSSTITSLLASRVAADAR